VDCQGIISGFSSVVYRRLYPKPQTGNIEAKSATARSAPVVIGASGWQYKDWTKAFYPDGIKSAEYLAYYTTQFPTVEINATFYRLPTPEAILRWRKAAPRGFLFAVKAPRAVTHFKRLLPGAKSFPLFLERIPELGDRLGPVLWQLPGSFHKNVERLESFLSSLPEGIHHAFEFRHESWFTEEVFATLRRHKAALVSVSASWLPADLTITADFRMPANIATSAGITINVIHAPSLNLAMIITTRAAPVATAPRALISSDTLRGLTPLFSPACHLPVRPLTRWDESHHPVRPRAGCVHSI
jgi:hypothetical protein